MFCRAASDSADKHPEKRLKSAYTAFEEKRMAQLKVENPNLRLSQLRQMLKKDWLKVTEIVMLKMNSLIVCFHLV